MEVFALKDTSSKARFIGDYAPTKIRDCCYVGLFKVFDALDTKFGGEIAKIQIFFRCLFSL